MKIIVAGSREVTDYELVARAIELAPFVITELVEGGCRGVDRLARQWASKNGIPVRTFEATWDVNGPAAGPLRNEQMAQYGEGLIAIWNGRSKGTGDMVRRAQAHGLRVHHFGLLDDVDE